MNSGNNPVQAQTQNYKEYTSLVEEFKATLNDGKYISELTGCILCDPILIHGSTDYVEREFIALSIQSNNQNPFTRTKMTLDELKSIPTETKIKEIIDNLIANFLSENKDHPDYEKITAAIEDAKYKEGVTKIEENSATGSVSATADDLLAMLSAMFSMVQPTAPASTTVATSMPSVSTDAVPASVEPADSTASGGQEASSSQQPQQVDIVTVIRNIAILHSLHQAIQTIESIIRLIESLLDLSEQLQRENPGSLIIPSPVVIGRNNAPNRELTQFANVYLAMSFFNRLRTQTQIQTQTQPQSREQDQEEAPQPTPPRMNR